jgi:acetyl-CoA synthetase
MAYPFQITSLDQYKIDYQKSIDHPELFWSEVAENFLWKKKWNKVMDCNFSEPSIRWFDGAQLNVTENCLDRHLAAQGDTTALIWESNNQEENSKTYTYKQLHEAVCQFSHVLKNNGIKKGDRVCIYMGMVPELAIAVLACARIGAIHSKMQRQNLSSRVMEHIEGIKTYHSNPSLMTHLLLVHL